MNDDRPILPIRELRSALGDNEHEAHATLDELEREIAAERPDRDRIAAHVDTLRAHAPLTVVVANWFEAPATQRFIEGLNALGL